jgi:hypothetical protein
MRGFAALLSKLTNRMILRRITLSIAWLLSATSISFAFQLQKSTAKIVLPATVNHPAIVNKQKPAQLHTSVSSHIHFPKRRFAAHHPVVKRFDVGGKAPSHSIVRSHKTSLTSNSGSITLSVDLGHPTTSLSKVTVANAPQGMKFSKVGWRSLARGMPPGIMLNSAQGGMPECPILNFTFSIPENANGITPILKTGSTFPLGNVYFPPSIKTIKGKSQRVYDANSYSASPTITVSKARTFRSLRMLTVSVPLISSNGNAATALQSFTVGINFTATPAPNAPTSATRDPVFYDLDSRMVANTWDLASFAVPLKHASQKPIAKPVISKGMKFSPTQSGADSIYSWIDTNAAYIRLAVTRDGLYRVNASDLNFQSLGFSLATSGWNSGNLRCFNHGVEIPIWIDTDASGNITDIEFYGQHLRGFPLPTVKNPYLLYDYQVQEGLNFQLSDTSVRLPEYYNVATDTNVYWLASTRGDNKPLRFTSKSLAPSNAPVVSSGMVLLHHEQDHNYYLGDATSDQTQTQEMTEYVAGERFEWAELYGTFDPHSIADSTKPHFTDTFYISKLPIDTTGKVATLKFFFRGMSSDPNVSSQLQHEVQAQVNTAKASHADVFGDYYYDSLTMSVPLSQLMQGPNVVHITALTTGSHNDEFYLDYYEVSFPDTLAPSADTGIAKGQWLFSLSHPPGPFQIGLTDGSAHLYNLTDYTRILSSNGQFFDSTSSPQLQYAAATTATLLKCDNIQAWNTGSPNVLSWQILNHQNQVDYLVITHPNFLQSAKMLASLRGTQGLKTKVVTTDEKFNAFDYGSNEPEAIRRYLNYAYNNYNGPPVALVTLLGNASWDPKFNLSGGVQKSFVPTYGNPASDFYYTLSGSDTALDSLPLMMISRIPVSSEAQAENYLTKLQEYENATPAPWDSRFLFIAGGEQANNEHLSFHDDMSAFIDTLSTPPTDTHDTLIDRTDFTSGVDPTHIGAIESLLLAGQSVMYFGGHGATFTSDVAFPDASILQNKGLYPLLITLTCRTGDFAEYNQIGVNQSYIETPEAGSVQAYGTTGFGVEEYDGALTLNWISLMRSFDSTHDTTRPESMNMLEMLTAAKMTASLFGYGGAGSVSHNESLQNSMLGDAAVGFALKPQPEFAVYANEVHGYALGNPTPQTSFSLSDSTITIKALIHNYGYAADRPVVIRITDAVPNGFPIVRFDTLLGINESATVSSTFGLNAQSIGSHHICVDIDPNHNFPEFDTADNSACIQIQVNGLSTTAFFPYEGERDLCDIGPNSVHFIVLPPSGSNPNDQVELQLDTTQAFSHFLVNRTASIGTAYYIPFDIPIPASPIPTSSVYWWRTRVLRTTGDTTQWQYATFSTGAAPRPEFSYTSPEQLSSTIVNGLNINTRGELYLPQQNIMRLEAISHGLEDSVLGQTFAPYAQVILNGIPYWQDTEVLSNGFLFDNGFVVLVWTPDGTQIDSVYEFEMHWEQINDTTFEDSMATIFNSVLASIPQTRRVIVLTVGSVEFNNIFFPAVQAQMESLGSAQGMSPMVYDGSYALIGAKGSMKGTAKEAFAAKRSSGAMAFDTSITAGTSGFAETPYTAGAKDYGALTWAGDPIVNGNDINFTVLGSRRDGGGVDVVDNFKASAGNSFSISNVDPRVYDRLAVQMGFTRSANTSVSPALSGIALQYDPAPEFTFTGDSILCTPKIVNSNGSIVANYTATTLTCTPGDSVLVLLTRQYQGKNDTPFGHLVPLLAGHGTQQFNDTIQTPNELGGATLTAIINPNEAQNEQLLFNNTISGSYTVTRDTISPSGEILFVDPTDMVPQHISADCGYVSSRSTIQIQMISSNPLRDTSSSSITADFLNENNSLYFPISTINTHGFTVTFKSFPGGALQAQLNITPAANAPFDAGTWLMHAYLHDASGNTDTLTQCFTISNVNGIAEVMNYPNPFKETTDFTFILKSDAPADIKIIVYTIAGRKIRTLTPTLLHAGFNTVRWDGRDEHGNEVANGTYLYRVVINGTNGDNVSDAVTQTAVRAR